MKNIFRRGACIWLLCAVVYRPLYAQSEGMEVYAATQTSAQAEIQAGNATTAISLLSDYWQAEPDAFERITKTVDDLLSLAAFAKQVGKQAECDALVNHSKNQLSSLASQFSENYHFLARISNFQYRIEEVFLGDTNTAEAYAQAASNYLTMAGEITVTEED